MKGQQDGGYGWVVGALAVVAVIVAGKVWGPPITYLTGDDAAAKIVRQLEENRQKASANR